MKIQVKPWTDNRGFNLPEHELREVSKNWNEQTWEEYLKTIESKISGKFFSPEIYDLLCDGLTENIFWRSSEFSSDEVLEQIQSAMTHLPEKQAKVIELIFWHGKSQHQIAKSLRIHQSSVFNLKNRAIKNLKISLQKLQGAVNPPLMRGECEFDHPSVQELSEEVCEVMQTEINRNECHVSFERDQNE